MIDKNAFGVNHPIYQRLKVALSLNLRRQIFLAVCDDLVLKNRIAAQLQAELAYPSHLLDSKSVTPSSQNSNEGGVATLVQTATQNATSPQTKDYPRFVSLHLQLSDPDITAQITQWLAQHSPQEPWGQSIPVPGFQILGIERLTRQSPSLQRLFLSYLQQMAKNIAILESSLLLWVPRPWFSSIQQSAPDFWRCHTGVFEFPGDPTPISDEEDTFNLPELGGWGNGEIKNTEETPPPLVPTTVKLEKQKVTAIEVEADRGSAEDRVERYRALGNTYRDRIQKGEVTQANLTSAIQAYEQALEHLEETSPLASDLLNDLANLYWLLSRHTSTVEQAQAYLDQALQVYQVALTKASAIAEPQTYARIQNNLGAAYGDLARYREPATNLQNSITAYQEALYHRASLSEAEENSEASKQYASTQNNLGTAYWNLAQHHNPVANLQNAIAAYQAALKHYSPEREPLSYGMIQNNLGTAFWNLAQYDKSPDYLQMAIWSYREALQYRTSSGSPTAHAATQNNLGTAYWHLANHSTTPTLKRAEELLLCTQAYHAALNAAEPLTHRQPPTPLNFDILATHNNLGLAYFQLATDGKIKAALASSQAEPLPSQLTGILEKSTDYLETALAHHIMAWQGWQQQTELQKTALSYVVQTVRALYKQGGISGQNQALSCLPPELLPDVMKRL